MFKAKRIGTDRPAAPVPRVCVSDSERERESEGGIAATLGDLATEEDAAAAPQGEPYTLNPALEVQETHGDRLVL